MFMKLLSFMVILSAMISMAYLYNIENIPAMIWTGIAFVTSIHIFINA